MVLEFIVLYNPAFLKRVFPKGQFPKQRIYTNCSFSLGSVSRRRRHSIQVLKRCWTAATFSYAPQPALWLFLGSFHFPLVFHVFASSPWPQHKLTTWELSIFFLSSDFCLWVFIMLNDFNMLNDYCFQDSMLSHTNTHWYL